MIDKKLYCETFSRLCASEKAKEEVFQMAREQKRPVRMCRILRTAAIAAALTAALAVTANAASDGALFQELRVIWSSGTETHLAGTAADGTSVDFTVSTTAPKVAEENGRIFLYILEEKIDITDQLKETGEYHWIGTDGKQPVEVDVTGTPEAWDVAYRIGENGITYTWDEDQRLTATEDGAAADGSARQSMAETVTGE